MIDCGSVLPTVGGTTFGQVVLGGTRKQDEQAMESKSVSSIPSWLLLQVPHTGS